ncbi:MAG: hypothetical protein A2176_06065 [Spirochaetes bacterium RBG_13_51_14]|nr:MAG: hypothetical protein A2176_06065 [Spirochaetes bacterium RBG_13_51_14]
MKKLIKSQLLVGASANILFGVAILFFPRTFALLIQFNPLTNELFRLFVSGVAIGLGIGYAYIYIYEPDNLSLLVFGMGLKYWAFIVTLYCFIVHDLSLLMFMLFGIGNFLLAVSFSAYLYIRRS